MSIIQNELRHGNFTSSEIVALTKTGERKMTEEEKSAYKKENPKGRKENIECWPGEAATTYILETNAERLAGVPIEIEVDAKATGWGKLCEYLVFLLLSTEYILTSTITVVHEYIKWWSGSPDGEKEDTVIDIKAPFTRKSFFALVDPIYNGYTGIEAMNCIRFGWVDKKGLKRKKHPDGEKYYWQLVSNTILRKKKYAELIVYMPYLSEIEAIKTEALKDEYRSKYFWLSMSEAENLPYIPDGGYYKNINIIRFEVPQADIDLLTLRILQGGCYLDNNPDAAKLCNEFIQSTILAKYDPVVNATIIE